MREWSKQLGFLIVLVLAFTLFPSTHREAAAACSPRLFSELGPAPNRVVPPQAPATGHSSAVQPFQAAEPPDDEPPPYDPPPYDPPPYDPVTPPPSDPVEPPPDATVDPAPVDPPPTPAPVPVIVTPPPARCSFYYDMDHPIAGNSQTLSVFGAIRAGGDRWHAGLDMAARKLTPVVAVRSGSVSEINRNGGGDCCWVKIDHSDGWQSLYVHLNNDVAGTDNGNGIGIVRDLRVGDAVKRGQVIGYVGDSGNAEPGVPHLHFELRTRWGESVDPLPSIRRAERRGVSGFAGLADPPYGFAGPFADVDESYASMVALGVSIGLPMACDEYGLFFCGDSDADEATLLGWIESLISSRFEPTSRVAAFDATAEVEMLAGDSDLERLLRLCPDSCRQVFSEQDVIAAVLLHVPTLDPSTAAALYLESATVGCDAWEMPQPEAIIRVDMLELVLRAFGYLPELSPMPEPPCDRIS